MCRDRAVKNNEISRAVTSSNRYPQSLGGIKTCLNHAAREYSARVITASAVESNGDVVLLGGKIAPVCTPEECVAPHGDIVPIVPLSSVYICMMYAGRVRSRDRIYTRS